MPARCSGALQLCPLSLSRVPPFTPLCLYQSRVEGTNQVAKVHHRFTLSRPSSSAGEQPGVLSAISKQCCLALLFLVFFACCWCRGGECLMVIAVVFPIPRPGTSRELQTGGCKATRQLGFASPLRLRDQRSQGCQEPLDSQGCLGSLGFSP